MSRDNEFVKKVLLNMKYDSSKTLSENKILLNEDPTWSSVSWTADKSYELDIDNEIGTRFIQKGFTMTGLDNKQYCRYGDCMYTKCPGPKCVALGKQKLKVQPDAFSPTYSFDLRIWCPELLKHLGDDHPMDVWYDDASWQFFSHSAFNSVLQSKLEIKFCRSAQVVDDEDINWVEIDLSNMVLLDDPNPGKLKSDATNQQQKTKTQAEINKELLSRDDAYKAVPRLYASSLGFKDWKSYQVAFCCPSAKENPTENAKCNENIGLAFSQGWRPGDAVPEGMRSSYCKEEEITTPTDVNVSIEGSGESISGEGEGTSASLNDEGIDASFSSESDPYYKAIDPTTQVWAPTFKTKFETWIDENFIYPKKAYKSKQKGISIVKFMVNADGTLSNFSLSESSGYKELDDYALELLKTMPDWNSAKKDGVNIPMEVSIPLVFDFE
jgi:TonB family protein